ncbi:MAG: glycosyltransferase [Oscillatoriophycideae cyanobacterium NC_groundwater_1537_Pr4_S-0.65um_50_18]|nr:glycosyltransferase [Oscillatoriophycideae cyanobacterium NC_groundwater_1537_Pr4_S-0.65um_50_18]
MKPPAISVLMPVYNGDRYLTEAVESVLAQTFTDFEFLIIDDGSTDRSLQILQQYAAQDDRIRLISRENRGLIATLNQMLELAQGEFLARMDADDIAVGDRFAAQLEFLRQHPDYVCVGGAFALMDAQGRTVLPLEMPETNDEIQQAILSGRTIINHPCAMIRRQALEAIGGYDTAMVTVEDLDMLLRLGEVGKLANLKQMVLKYRFHMESVSAKRSEFQHQMAQEACRRAWQRRGITGEFAAEMPWYRPGRDRPSRQSFFHRYGWWAFNNGWRSTAASSALRAIALQPITPESWKLLACALIKPIP